MKLQKDLIDALNHDFVIALKDQYKKAFAGRRCIVIPYPMRESFTVEPKARAKFTEAQQAFIDGFSQGYQTAIAIIKKGTQDAG